MSGRNCPAMLHARAGGLSQVARIERRAERWLETCRGRLIARRRRTKSTAMPPVLASIAYRSRPAMRAGLLC